MLVKVRRVISVRNRGVILSGSGADGEALRFIVHSVRRVPRPGEIWRIEGEVRTSPAFGVQFYADTAEPEAEPPDQSVNRSVKLAGDAVHLARRISPEAVLRTRFADIRVSRGGASLAIEGILRADRRDDGHWVACDWAGSGIGDNIALLVRLLGVGFREAVSLLMADASQALPPPSTSGALEAPFALPPYEDAQQGRAYLERRGISQDAVRSGETCGAVRYARGAVVFVGLDHGFQPPAPRSAAIRSYVSGARLPKRDIAGSNKLFPVLFAGSSQIVVVVEGGISGLAAWDLIRLQQEIAPTVIATGGVSVHRWATANAPLSRLLADADFVEVWGEHETTPEKQFRTDAQRKRLLESISVLRGSRPSVLRFPPTGASDAADWLLGLRDGRHDLSDAGG
jgi:hypothetical protein